MPVSLWKRSLNKFFNEVSSSQYGSISCFLEIDRNRTLNFLSTLFTLHETSLFCPFQPSHTSEPRQKKLSTLKRKKNQQIHNIKIFIQSLFMETSSENDTPPPSNRDYICPCGKSYLSYAAIFTHIKLKHAGKPPGPIRKPKVKSKPRGRPPLGPKKDGGEKLEANKEKTDGGWKSGKPQNKIYWEQFQQIFNYLKQISYQECIDPKIWEKVEAFQKIQNFINSKDSDHDFQFNGVNIGRGLSEFFKHVSNHSENWRFEQMFILFALLLQYVIDENNDDSIVNQAPIEYLIEYMNSFISDFIQDEGERLGIQNLWMMRKQNIVKTFYCFYNWLKWKEYTHFSITVNR